MRNGMTFLSNSVYLPIKERGDEGYLSWRYSKIWLNFRSKNAEPYSHSLGTKIHEELVKYNARLVNDVIVFDTDQDKMWFVLNWS